MNITDFSTSILFAVAILAGPACGEVAIVDGDTFDLNGVRIRLNGIDAPEYGQTCGSWKCGADALEALNTLVNSGPVTCQKMGDDGYGRIIARCSVQGRDIGATMVSEGMAYAFVKYSADYVAEEKQAQSMKTGLWRGDFQKPWEYRAEKWEVAEQEAPDGCPIKGNISENGRTYHAPWSPWYKKTKIDEAKEERWFCSEAEAVSAGWRAPKWR